MPTVAVFRDGLLARRRPELLEPEDAEKMAQAMNRLPTILEAWVQAVPRSRRKLVCWLPSSARAQAAMEQALQKNEEKKAHTEGAAFIWSATVFGPSVRACYNPKSGRAYLVTHDGGERFHCQCPRYQSAGVCKHVCAARQLSRRCE
ncbi:hypothetical protein [Armatimonas rosea]|uniref:SWIM-type domain-containing protein n=1 Tax=Armatimonas rosea TaxID=685828 RepID=A0A7W9SVH6_ARMRO|nr:hypothetical protein [Armatimonas rosea]MBB6053615.1 hypothetical protein [Armatimonas rosea]